MFNVLIHRKALKEIDGLPAEDKQRILSAIGEMAIDPFVGDVKPIRNVKGLFRRRVGDFRPAFFHSQLREESGHHTEGGEKGQLLPLWLSQAKHVRTDHDCSGT